MFGGGQNSNQIGSPMNQFGCCFGSGGPTLGGVQIRHDSTAYTITR